MRGRVASGLAAVTLVALVLASAGPAASTTSGGSGGGRLWAHTSGPSADEGTSRGGLSREGWYPEANLLTPATVAHDGFGQLYTIPVDGQVYAQPVMDGAIAVIATEKDWVYGVNQVTGSTVWKEQLGADVGAQPFNEIDPTVSTLQPWGCHDLLPDIGVTSTPVVDPTTGVIYVVAMEQLTDGTLGYFMHALSPVDGGEEPGFPVRIGGTAQNNPAVAFRPTDELQRVGLTLVSGVVYAGFWSHCDTSPYQGFVAGVTEGGRQTALWTDVYDGNDSGGGIWQSGGGFSSDGPGQLLIATANGNPGEAPSGTIAGDEVPKAGQLTESVVRLGQQADGSLTPTDFFTPYDAINLDDDDLDLGSGSPVLLPSSMGTASTPHLLLQVGKEGYLYLLNRDDLGGVSPGDAGALAEHPTVGGAWATPAVWPGGGGYIYVPTANGGFASLGNESQGDFNVFKVQDPSTSSPSFGLTLVASATQPVGFGTSAPIVTSDGLTNGSAVVWVVRFAGPTGANADLQAYNAVPTGSGPGGLSLIGQWPVTDAVKFAPPGVGDNRLYVPTKNDQVDVFGLHAPSLLTGQVKTFADTTIGHSTTATVTLTATQAVTLEPGAGGCGVCTRTSQFSVTSTTPSVSGAPVTIASGHTLSVSLRFAPTGTSGERSDVLRVVTTTGEADFSLQGTGRAATPWVVASTQGLTLPAYVVKSPRAVTSSFTLTNFGAQAARVTAETPSLAPFTVTGVPAVGSAILPGHRVTVTVSLRTSVSGTFHRQLIITTNSPSAVAREVIQVSGAAHTAPVVTISPASRSLSFGTSAAPLALGGAMVDTVTVTDRGGTLLTLNAVNVTGPFTLLNAPPADFEVPPKVSISLHVLSLPTAAGAQTGSLTLSAAGLKPTVVRLTGQASGSGASAPGPSDPSWLRAGSASVVGSTIQLTPVALNQSGSAFWSSPVTTGAFAANFTAEATGGSGADGLALVIAKSSSLGSPPAAPLGGYGDGIGFAGDTGLAVVVGEYWDPGTPGFQWVGVADGPDPSTGGLNWLAAPTAIPESTQDTPNDVTVALAGGTISVWVDGLPVLTQAVTAPSSFVIGFSAGTGDYDNLHEVSGLTIVAAA